MDQPPPSLVNDYLNYLLSEGQIPQFEQSVIRLPVESLDLHQVNFFLIFVDFELTLELIKTIFYYLKGYECLSRTSTF